MWWPNGYGDQKLYNLIVELGLIPGSGSTGGDKFKFHKTIGFRTVELVQDPIESNKGIHDCDNQRKDDNL